MKEHIIKIPFFIFSILILSGCQEQYHETEWEKLPAPISARIGCFAEAPNGTYYVGASELYKSEDLGSTWELVNFKGMPMEILVTESGTLLVGTYRGGIFRSIDQGESWTHVGFEDNVYVFKIIQIGDGRIFTSTTFLSEGASKESQAGVFVSQDDGLTWQQTSITHENIKGVFNPKPGIIFASGTGEDSFYRSIDNGQSWSTNVSGLPDTISVSGIVALNGNLFASVGDPQDAARITGGGIFKSEDDGLTWIKSDNGLSENTKVSDITIIDNTLFVSTGYQVNIGDRGVFKSEDLGQTWLPTGLNDLQLRLIRPTSRQQVIAGSNVSSIFISNNKGESWLQTGKEIENWFVFQVMENNNYLFANGESGIWRADIPVKEWQQIRNETGSLVQLPSGKILMAENGKILTSEDNGDHWSQIADLKSEMIFLYALDSKLLVACAQEDGIYYSTNDGHDWLKYSMGMFEQNTFRTAIKTPGGALLTGTARGTLRSDDQGKTWKNVDENFFAWTFTKSNNIIYAGGYADGIRKSTNDGLTWTEFNSGLREGDNYLTVTSLCATSDNSVICGTLGEGIYLLKSNDSIWSEHKIGLTDLVNFGIIEGNNGIIYSTSQKGIFKRN
ncbi:WD40/YVTN/BNR-like repeat-containing protein [Eudoraea sp.]|uniref:WD40/YVTN/BNR-like repeat-containing protein n=1 Tax=Eudoraea sp. TaxID=1979955 RepID=UPI003C787E24